MKMSTLSNLICGCPHEKNVFAECSYQRSGKLYCGRDIKLSESVRSSDSYVELNQYSTFRCPLVSIKSCLDICGDE